MNHTVKGFQISFLFHAALLSLVFGLSHSIKLDRRPPIVIDFSVADDMKGVAEKASAMPLKASVKKETSAPEPAVHRPKAKVMAKAMVRKSRCPVPPSAPPEKEATADKETAPVHEAVNRKQAEAADGASILQPAPDARSHGSGLAQPEGVRPSGQDSGQDAGHGLSAGDGQRQRYIKEHFAYIRDMIIRNLSYPMIARKAGWSGRVVVSFTVLDDGRVEDVKVVKSSGFGVLDANAIKTIEKAAPFPRPPVKAELIIPVVYRLS